MKNNCNSCNSNLSCQSAFCGPTVFDSFQKCCKPKCCKCCKCDNDFNPYLPKPPKPDPGPTPEFLKETKNLAVSNPTTESLTENSVWQQQINEEFKFSLLIWHNQWIKNILDIGLWVEGKIGNYLTSHSGAAGVYKKILLAENVNITDKKQNVIFSYSTDNFSLLQIDVIDQNGEKNIFTFNSTQIPKTRQFWISQANSAGTTTQIMLEVTQSNQTTLGLRLINSVDSTPIIGKIFGINLPKYSRI